MDALEFKFKIMPYFDPKFIPQSAHYLEHTDGVESTKEEAVELDLLEESDEDFEFTIETIYKYQESFFVKQVENGVFPAFDQVSIPEIPSFCINLETEINKNWTQVLNQPSCVLNNTGSLHLANTDSLSGFSFPLYQLKPVKKD